MPQNSTPAPTAAPLVPARDWAEIDLCPDCAIVIANGDTSGLADPDAHLAAMDATLTGHAIVVCAGEDCEAMCSGFRYATCGGCGLDTVGDWHAGLVELPAATPAA